jgi:hypothetical protein
MSLVVERWTSKPSQPNNRSVIKYVSRNSMVGEHGHDYGVDKTAGHRSSAELWRGTGTAAPTLP